MGRGSGDVRSHVRSPRWARFGPVGPGSGPRVLRDPGCRCHHLALPTSAFWTLEGSLSVSVTDYPDTPLPPEPDWGDGPAAYEPGNAPRSSGDRTPPQDNAAEQSVLGAMLLSKDAIADVGEVVRGTDFYRPAHEVIYDAIVDLYGRGEPADPVTVAAELHRARGAAADRRRPVPAHARRPTCRSRPTPATTPRSCARRRSCAAWSTPAPRSSSSATPARARSTTVVDEAQAEVYKVTDKRTPGGLRPARRHHGGRPRRDRGDRQP